MVNRRVSHYFLTRPLGAGAFGEVWEGVHAEDPAFRVAVKLLSPTLHREPMVVEALKAECRALDRLDHPNIVRFRELVVEPGRVAMVLELLEGEDLAAAVNAGPQPALEVVRLLEGALQGLAFAHAQGVMHQDIKPGNVFRCRDGRVKIMDFGVSQAVDRGAVPDAFAIRGTLGYLAPERFVGFSRPAGDVYGIGLVAWELLSGSRACPDGDLMTQMAWHRDVGVVDIRELRPEVPEWLACLVAALAARDPDGRPVDGAAALALLRELRDPLWEGLSPTLFGAHLRPVPTGPQTVEVSTATSRIPEAVPTSTGDKRGGLGPTSQPPRTSAPGTVVRAEAPRSLRTADVVPVPAHSVGREAAFGRPDPYRAPTSTIPAPPPRAKSRIVFLALTILCPNIGLCGLQHFYTGHWGRGIFLLLTFGCCGFWQLADVFWGAFGPVKDSKGVPLRW